MASQTQGIQQLLVAEKRAAEKVSEARKRKNRRLKQAKEEAQVQLCHHFIRGYSIITSHFRRAGAGVQQSVTRNFLLFK